MMIHKMPGLSGNFQALLEFRIESGGQTLQHHLKTAPKNATHFLGKQKDGETEKCDF